MPDIRPSLEERIGSESIYVLHGGGGVHATARSTETDRRNRDAPRSASAEAISNVAWPPTLWNGKVRGSGQDHGEHGRSGPAYPFRMNHLRPPSGLERRLNRAERGPDRGSMGGRNPPSPPRRRLDQEP